MQSQGLMGRSAPIASPIQFYLKIAILGLSLICLICAAASLGILSSRVGVMVPFSGGGYMIFVVCQTFIIYGAIWAVEAAAPQLYFRIGVILAYCFNIIFWLSGWAWSASLASAWCSLGSTFNAFSSSRSSGCVDGGGLAAAAAFGAIAWIACLAHLFIYTRACLNDVPADDGVNSGELGQVKTGMPYPAASYNSAQSMPQAAYPIAQQPTPAYSAAQ